MAIIKDKIIAIKIQLNDFLKPHKAGEKTDPGMVLWIELIQKPAITKANKAIVFMGKSKLINKEKNHKAPVRASDLNGTLLDFSIIDPYVFLGFKK